MIIFTLRRILLLIVTLFLLTFVGFSLSYFTPHAPLQGASLWNATNKAHLFCQIRTRTCGVELNFITNCTT